MVALVATMHALNTGLDQLSFVGTEDGGAPIPGRDVVAIGLRRASAAGLLEGWRGEGLLNAATPARILQVQPIWPIEPFALMVP